MKRSSRTPGKRPVPLWIRLALLAAVIILLVWSIILTRDKLLRNAKEMGIYLAESYAMEEENRINVYSLLLGIGSSYLDDNISQGLPTSDSRRLLEQYSDKLTAILGNPIIDPYAVIQGEIIAANPWEGDDSYDYSQTQWYQEALAAEGGIIYTDSYRDAITGENIITLAQKLTGDGNVLAFDIALDDFHTHKNSASMPENSSYYLFDRDNKLMYSASVIDTSSPEAQSYLENLVTQIRGGELQDYDSSVTDLNGRQRGVYYHEMSNGWLAVITIPLSNILQDGWDSTLLFLAAICAALAAAAAFIVIRGYFGARHVQHISDTLRLLGDSYYAIYRINYRTELYETIKSSPDVEPLLGASGTYRHLLDVLETIVEDGISEKIETSFDPENIRTLIRDGVYDFGGDFKRLFPDGYKWVRIQIIYSKAMHLDEVIMCFREIDADKRQELQQYVLLENALATAKKTVQQKAMFFSNASHDMRTPLNAIIGLSGLALKNPDDREQLKDYLMKIEQSGKQLLNLVNDVLDMSRLEHEKGNSLDYAPMNLVKCVEDCVSMFRAQVQEEKKLLQTDFSLDHPDIFCDWVRLTQVLNNLISNAVKYSGEGARITVSVKEMNFRQGHGKYQIVVADTGIGMSPEFLEHIFEPFSRETLFTARKITGTGLGMPIVQALVQQMSGEILVQSTPGEGSVFTVTLPLRIAESPQGDAPEPSPDQSTDTLAGKTLLLAEDNEINMEIATEYLTMMGASVLQAWNGMEAVEIYQARPEGSIDAILLDMQMPVMDGCSAAKAIRALDKADAKTIPIIAVTANVFAEDIAKTTEAGMNAHIPKPIDYAQLAKILEQYSRGRQAPG